MITRNGLIVHDIGCGLDGITGMAYFNKVDVAKQRADWWIFAMNAYNQFENNLIGGEK